MSAAGSVGRDNPFQSALGTPRSVLPSRCSLAAAALLGRASATAAEHPLAHSVKGVEGLVGPAARTRQQALVLVGNARRGGPRRLPFGRALPARRLDRWAERLGRRALRGTLGRLRRDGRR